MNIFWEHYKKRDGAIYKDLAGSTHKQRIKMLNEFIEHCMDMTGKISNKSLIKANKRSIRFYYKLKDYCNKNKHIQKIPW